MYERFTDRARKVMQLANQEAVRFNHEYIGTEHILLGLVKEGSGVAASVLKNLDIDLRKIRLEVEKIVMSGPDMVRMGKLPQTPKAKKVIEFAIEEARRLTHNYVGTEHMLLGLLREQEGVAAQVLMNLGLKLEYVRQEVLNLLGHNPESKDIWAGQRPVDQGTGRAQTPTLDSLGTDLTALARAGRLAPCIGRANEIDRVLLVLGCLEDSNPLLVGPLGVGKRTLVHGLARLAVGDNPPEVLRGRRIVQVSVRATVLLNHDDSEKLLRTARGITNEVQRACNVLLFIDDLFGYGHDSRLFKSVLDTPEVPCIASATPKLYHAVVDEFPVFARNFQPIFLEPPPADEVVEILRAQRNYYEEHHRVRIGDDALTAAAALSEHHLTEGCQPARALRLLDQAAALFRMRHAPIPPDVRELDAQVAQLTEEKERAVAEQDFEKAAQLRDQADRLAREKERLVAAWRPGQQQGAGVVDAGVVEQVVTKLTGVQFRGSDAFREKP
jgi:ATP-dependent Clp protease ATP-binding subunit ClpC